jgi:hypothetical protein
MSSFSEAPLEFVDNGPVQTSWDNWGENGASPNSDALKDFPALPLQDYKNGGSTVPDLLTGTPDKLNKENLAWLSQKELFPYLPDKPVVSEKPVAAMSTNPLTKKEEFHDLDPDNPEFEFKKYYNPITQKYGCPWAGCK